MLRFVFKKNFKILKLELYGDFIWGEISFKYWIFFFFVGWGGVEFNCGIFCL